MYVPTGFWKTELGDVDVIAHGGLFHAFHLDIPNHDGVSHLVSADGLNWSEQPKAIRTGDPGDFDDDQIWTMGVFEHGGAFFMLYTGLARKERGKRQRVGLAVSKDLCSWEKHAKNPVACADPRWYEATLDATHRVDWRDPKVFKEDGVLHAVVSAHANSGPANRRGCAGHFVSTNGYDWEVKPPLHVPNTCYDFETPALCKVNGRYYLTGISGRDCDRRVPNVYRVADALGGPWRSLGHDDLLPSDNSVYKPCEWGGNTLFFHNLRGDADWPSGAGQTVTCLPPPKVADSEEDGTLVLRPFQQWDPAAAGPWRGLSSGSPAGGEWQAGAAGLRGRCAPGLGAFLFAEPQAGFLFEADLEVSGAREAGVVFRSDADADCATFVSLAPATRRVQLYTQREFYKTPSAGITYRWRGRRLVQENVLPAAWRTTVRLRVVAWGPYVEASVNDRVAISAVTMAAEQGRVGVFAEDGPVAAKNLRLRPLHPPDSQKNLL